MPEPDQPEVEPQPDLSVEDRLRFALSLTNDWLKFAEAKNGALLALCVGAVAAGLSLLKDVQDHDVRVVLILVMWTLGVAAVISLCSFLPQLMPSSDGREGDFGESNPFFFGHAARADAQCYAASLRRVCGLEGPTQPVHRLELCYADQIVTNSRIARRKFRMFGWAANCILVGAAIIVIGGLKGVFF